MSDTIRDIGDTISDIGDTIGLSKINMSDIPIQEVKKAISTLKNNKMPGPGNIPAKLLKHEVKSWLR